MAPRERSAATRATRNSRPDSEGHPDLTASESPGGALAPEASEVSEVFEVSGVSGVSEVFEVSEAPEAAEAAEASEAAEAPEAPEAPEPAGPLPEEAHPVTLAIDIGGTGIKGMLLDHQGTPLSERLRIATPQPASPDRVMPVIDEIYSKLAGFDRVSVGFPGVVHDSVVKTAPNLHPRKWADFPLGQELSRRTGKPARVINDAGVQGYGVIEGRGVEMLLTFGTGMGCALFLDGRYVPNLELGHHPLRKGRTYEEYVCDGELKRVGERRWLQRVRRIVDQVLPIWNPRLLYLGGGNARLICGKLPANVRVVENVAGLLGGIALWRH